MYRFRFNVPGKFEEVVNFTVKSLANIDFDVLVFRGFSGAIVGAPVALRLKKDWALVRKPQDASHTTNRIEGNVWGRYIVIDDFIDTGATLRTIQDAVKEFGSPSAECLGCVLYDQQWLESRCSSREVYEQPSGMKILNWRGIPAKPNSQAILGPMPKFFASAKEGALFDFQKDTIAKYSNHLNVDKIFSEANAPAIAT